MRALPARRPAVSAVFDPNVLPTSATSRDLFGSATLFGSRRSGTRVQRGADLRYDLDLTFEDAAFGPQRRSKCLRHESCAECDGTGAEKGSGGHVYTCNGYGQVRFQGFFHQRLQPVSWRGQVIKNKCKVCHGEGRVVREKHSNSRFLQVSITVQARVSGEGDAGGRGGTSGDLYVVLIVREHEFFDRREQRFVLHIQ